VLLFGHIEVVERGGGGGAIGARSDVPAVVLFGSVSSL
jgi:hypothetical protein